jgi:hypothetical protein
MRRTILLAGVLPFVSAFLGGALAFSLAAAPQATAQSSQAQEVRASAFTLVGPDGTVLARLGPTTPSGNGLLTLNDAAGTRRLILGNEALRVFDEDGTLRFGAGYQPHGFFRPPAPPINGVSLDRDGSIGMIPPSL